MNNGSWRKGDIDGVLVRRLEAFPAQDGWLTEVFRSNSGLLVPLEQFQVNLSYVLPGKIKAFHAHKKQTDLITAIGNCRIVLLDDRYGSKTTKCYMDICSYPEARLQVLIPPGVLHGFQALGPEAMYLLYCANQLYGGKDKKEDPDELRYSHVVDGFSWTVEPD